MIAIEENIDLQSYNTLAIAAKARFFAQLNHPEQLPELMAYVEQRQIPFLVLGGGSNIVFSGDYPGLVIQNKIIGINVDEFNAQEVLVTAAAGENWHKLVCFCLQQDYRGIENLSLIPGSVGAAPVQNIGAYGVELRDVFASLKGWDCESKSFKTMNLEQCQFAYRDSIFKSQLKNRFIITEVSLRLSKTNSPKYDYKPLQQALIQQNIIEPTAQQLADAVIAIRQSKLPDPSVLANAGSFFKNPIVSTEFSQRLAEKFSDLVTFKVDANRVKIAAAWLLEKNGWKGRRLGNVGMHDKQALVMINHGPAAGEEVIALAALIQQDVLDTFGIRLEIEPVII